MREDFFYRIFVVDIPVPPLRERKEDLPKLIEFFFAKFSPLDAKVQIPEELVRLFLAYDWPGNVRELQNVILRYLATGQVQFIAPTERMAESSFAPSLFTERETDPERNTKTEAAFSPLKKMLEQAERAYILQALAHCNGNKAHTARLLGVKLRTFHSRCARLGIRRPLS